MLKATVYDFDLKVNFDIINGLLRCGCLLVFKQITCLSYSDKVGH